VYRVKLDELERKGEVKAATPTPELASV
jgi:hypothetical protein